MQLPNELMAFLAGLIGFLVTQGLKELGSWLGVDLSGNAAKVTTLIVALLAYLIEMLLALIPTEYRPLAGGIFGLLATILTMLGAHYSYKALKPKGP